MQYHVNRHVSCSFFFFVCFFFLTHLRLTYFRLAIPSDGVIKQSFKKSGYMKFILRCVSCNFFCVCLLEKGQNLIFRKKFLS